MIDLIVFDIDGVLINGNYTIDTNGVESKTIAFKDLDSFNLIKKLGIKTMLLTSEKNSITTYFKKKFKPDYFIDGVQEKFSCLKNLVKKEKIDFSKICYIGDGKKDIECLKNCGLSICPLNAVDEVANICNIKLNVTGGNGVVYEVYKIICNILANATLKSKSKIDSSDFLNIIEENKKIYEDIIKDADFYKNLNAACEIIIKAINNNNIIFSCGNGGSAADSEHFAAELINKFKKERKALPAISLTANSAIITSIGNDSTFDDIFARQIVGLGNKNDVLLAITTSGNSRNISLAINAAKKKQMKIILLTSIRCNLKDADVIIIKIPSNDTARIQEIHIMIIHYICDVIERMFN